MTTADRVAALVGVSVDDLDASVLAAAEILVIGGLTGTELLLVPDLARLARTLTTC